MYKPTYLKLWERPSYYIGEEFYGHYVFPLTRTRDSDALENSNYETALKALIAVPEPQEWSQDTAPVYDARFGHWGPGWIEVIFIHEAAEAALKLADELMEAYQDYPCLDEEDYSSREYDNASEYWANMSVRDRYDMIKSISEWARPSIFGARHDYIPKDPAGHLYMRLTTP